jgi:hypothetical protein
MKYEVQTKFVFSGTFNIEAKNAAQAKEFVQKHCGLVIGGDIHTTLSEEDCDWDFDVHPDKITVKVRRA